MLYIISYNEKKHIVPYLQTNLPGIRRFFLTLLFYFPIYFFWGLFSMQNLLLNSASVSSTPQN